MGLLNRIEIKGLFGHYSYDLPLRVGQRKDICFLTGPNGYGKSTILQLVYAFLKTDARTLVSIPYDEITFYLKDYKVVVKQERMEQDIDIDSSSSDDNVPTVVTMTTTVYSVDGNQELESLIFEDKDLIMENPKVFPPSLSVFHD